MSKNHSQTANGQGESIYANNQLRLKDCSIGIVVSDYNSAITHKLVDGAMKTLRSVGVTTDQIQTIHVPGAWELPLAVQLVLKQTSSDAVLAFGCVIKGKQLMMNTLIALFLKP